MAYEITGGVVKTAKKVVIYGTEGIGKSTLASQFPDPVFIDTEGSTSALDVRRFPTPTSYTMLIDEIDQVKNSPGLCKTLVVDTADWAEKLCTADVLASSGMKGIEDFGYGKGYTYVYEHFGKIISGLSAVVKSGTNVVVTAHALMRKFEQPDEMGAYDRWELKLNNGAKSNNAAMLKEWADILLFCNYKTFVVEDSKTKSKKAQGGRRVMYSTHHPCWDAKNRYGLPDEMEMSYESLRQVIEGNTVSPAPAAAPAKPAPEPDTKNDPLEERDIGEPDPAIPQSVRELMIADNVCEWDIQNIMSIKGYYPADVKVRDYDPAFIDGVLVGAWPQILKAIKEALASEEVPFN